MNDASDHKHISEEECTAYFARHLDADEEERVEMHFAECTPCAERASAMYSLIPSELDRWTARTHGVAIRDSESRASLPQRAARLAAALAERPFGARRWLEMSPQLEQKFQMIKDAVAGADRRLVSALIDRAQRLKERWPLGPFIEEMDPLYVLMAGDGGGEEPARAIATAPVWFTQLREPPSSLRWTTDEPGPFTVKIWQLGGDTLLQATIDTTTLSLAGEDTTGWPRGVLILWEVSDASGDVDIHAVQGAFRLLTEQEATDARQEIEVLSSNPEPARSLALAQCYSERKLYEDLVMHAHAAERQMTEPQAAFLLRRRLAAAYGDMQRQLARLGLGNPEALWAAAAARQEVRAGYEALAVEPEARQEE